MSNYIHCMPRLIKVYKSKINNSGIYILKNDLVTIESKSNVIYDSGRYPILYKLSFIKRLRDLPNESYMKLCAKIGDNTEAIGKVYTFVAKKNGLLKLFANDIFFLRWNNSGYIVAKITIKRPI